MYEERTKSTEGHWYDVTFTGVNKAPDGSYRPTTPQTVPFWSEPYQLLHERYTPNSGDDRREWKDFEHYKLASSAPIGGTSVRQVTDSFVASIDLTNPVYTVGIHSEPRAGSYPSLANGSTCGPALLVPTSLDFIPKPSGLSVMEAAAYRSFVPQMRAGLSSVNSLIELKDIASLRSTIGGVSSSAGALLAILNKNYKRAFNPSWTFRELAQRWGDIFLQWKFNIRPLISDISGITTTMSRLERRLNDLVSRANRPLIAYYVRDFKEFDDGEYFDVLPYHSTQFSGQPWWYGSNVLHRQVKFRPTQFHACMKYSYYYPSYTLVHARVKGLLDGLGVNLNPAIVWNAIKWTWLFDYVVNVSSFLDSLKVLNLEPVINIRDYCWSVKRQKEIWHTSKVCQSSLVGDSGQTVSLPTVFETAYRRYVTMPTKSSLEVSGLNSSEFAIGAALVLSRRKRYRTRSR